MYLIGLMDYDAIKRGYYKAPNYDLGVTYAALKEDKDKAVRLITSFSSRNLKQYDKIYIFRVLNFLPHPSTAIKDYYSYPIEEYGPGFNNKPLRPNELETKFTTPDFTCYNGMIIYSLSNPKSKIAWTIDKKPMTKKEQPIRLYEQFDGEELKKDLPKKKNLMIYDDPVNILNSATKMAELDNLLDKNYKIRFAQEMDISRVTDTNILERVFKHNKYALLRQRIMCSDIFTNVPWLLERYINKEYKKPIRIDVNMDGSLTPDQCLKILLTMGYWNAKTHYIFKLIPTWGRTYYYKDKLVLAAFNYLLLSPEKQSYYDYVYLIGYLHEGVRASLLTRDEEGHEYVYSNFNPPPMLERLERWLEDNPDYEEHIFIGGISKYERGRKEIFNSRRSAFNVIRSDN